MFPIKGPLFGIDSDLLKQSICEVIKEGSCGTGGNQSLPNLDFGKETTMPILYRSKQVYATLINFGALPNTTTKTVNHGITDIEWAQISNDYSVILDENHTSFQSHLANDCDTIQDNWEAYMDKTTITLRTKINRSMLSAHICVMYTKAADSPIL